MFFFVCCCCHRLYSADGHALIDLLQKVTEPPPAVGQKVLCRHPFQESKRAYVIPTHVESLYKIYWQNGKICQPLPRLEQVRERVQMSLKTLRNDHKRTLNPTPYKVNLNNYRLSSIICNILECVKIWKIYGLEQFINNTELLISGGCQR